AAARPGGPSSQALGTHAATRCPGATRRCSSPCGAVRRSIALHERRAPVALDTMAARDFDPATLDIATTEHYERNGYPHAEWTWLREHAPVFWYERANVAPFWVITKHADIIAISKQPERFLLEPP